MSENAAPQPAPVATRPHARQDQTLANTINQTRTALTACQGHAELGALLEARGYDAAALTAGLALCDAAQAGFNARQDALSSQQQASTAAQAADRAARAGFDDFRKIARAVFANDPVAQNALGAAGRVSHDQEQFLTAAAAACTAALNHPAYLTALSKRGYTQAALAAEQARLAALTQASAAHEAAKAAAQRATAERAAARKTLDVWWAEFRAVARVALKARSDLAGVLGVSRRP